MATRFMAAVICFLVLGQSEGIAKVDINNVVASVRTEEDPQNPDAEKVLVTVTYDLEGTKEGKGAVITFDANLSSPKRTEKIRPLDSELEGDFGSVLGDGSKQIVWDARATLERLGIEGKYDATVDISAEGQGNAPTRATLKIDGYDPSVSHPYFDKGTVVMSDLKEVEKSVICAQTDHWETTVDEGAIFYQGTVSGFPTYRGRFSGDKFWGPVTDQDCSGFLAITEAGTVDEKVWVNFTGEFEKTVDVNGKPVTANYVFQIRYNRIRTGDSTNVKEFVKIGNAGKPRQEGSFSEAPAIATYSAHIDIGKEDVESSDEFELEVLKYVYKWYEGGALAMEVRAKDGGHFVEEGGTYTLEESKTVTVNEKVTLSGTGIAIDTTWVSKSTGPQKPVLTFSGTISADGLATASNLTASPWVLGKELTLFPGSDWRADGANLVLSAFQGVQFFPTRYKFEGGVKATGVTMDGRFLLHSAVFGCVNPDDPANSLQTYKSLFGSPVGVDVEDVDLVDGKLSFNKLKITNFGIKVVPGLCLEEFVYAHDPAKDSLGVAAKLKLPLPIDSKVKSLAGGFSLYKGVIDRAFIEVETNIPIEPPPLTFKGFKAEFSNYLKGPLTIVGTAKFSHLTGEDLIATGLSYNGPFQKVAEFFPTIFELDGGVKVKWPYSWGFTGGIKIFGLEDAGVWLAEGTATTAVDPLHGALSLEDGTLKLVTIKDNKPLFDGSFSGSICLDFGAPVISLKSSGAVYVPNLFSEIPFFSKFGAMLGLPISLGSVALQLRNSEGSFKYKVGPRGTERVVRIDLTELPGPGAFECMNCESIAGGSRAKSELPSTLGVDTTFLAADISDEYGEVAFQVVRASEYATSVLVDPSGTLIDMNTDNPSITVDSLDLEEKVVLWTVVDPTPGEWKIGVVAQRNDDRVDIMGVRRLRSAFEYDVAIDGRSFVATWDPTDASDSSVVDFFLDRDNQGYNGLYIGSVNESAGRFEYALTDSLSECSYFLQVGRYDRGDYQDSYFSEPIANPKSSLLPPEDLAMTVDGENNVTLTWTPTNDSAITSYLVMLTDSQGNDSVIGSVSSLFNAFQFQTDGEDAGMTLAVRAVAVNSNLGCWSEPVSVPISSVEGSESPENPSSTLSARIMPNPASKTIEIELNLPEPGPIEAILYSSSGAPVRTLLAGEFIPGAARAIMNVEDIPSGSYLLLVLSGTEVTSVPVVIRR